MKGWFGSVDEISWLRFMYSFILKYEFSGDFIEQIPHLGNGAYDSVF